MDFNKAIEVHTHWKSRLKSYLSKPDKSLNADVVSQDSECDLGKWIHGEGRAHSGLPEFSILVKDHARFHRAAGEIIRKADIGKDMHEEVMLGSKSEYGVASAAVVMSLMKMKMRVQA